MVLPPIARQLRANRWWVSGAACRRHAIERTMNAMRIVVGSEFIELSRQVGSVPEKFAVKQLAPNRTDQALDEWMGDRRLPGDELPCCRCSRNPNTAGSSTCRADSARSVGMRTPVRRSQFE